MPPVACLPMYDFPQLRAAHDRLWSFIASRLRAAGVENGPAHLNWEPRPLPALWSDPTLLFSQTCGYPLVSGLAGAARVVAAPVYRFPGCEGATHRSFILVAAGNPARSLRELRGSRCVLNGEDSNTGMNLLRAAVAGLGVNGPFFATVRVVGAHAASVAEIAAGRADIAAIDCVTHAYLARFDPDAVARTRILAESQPSPALPIITGSQTPDAVVHALADALLAVGDAAELAETRDTLGLAGFVPASRATYDAIRDLERFAIERGYPRLC